MAGHIGPGAPSIRRALFKGVLRLGLPLPVAAISLFGLLLWTILPKTSGGQLALATTLAALGASVVTMVVQSSFSEVGKMVDEASERLHLSEVIYAEVRSNGELAGALAHDPLITGPAVEPFSEDAWLRGRIAFGTSTLLDSRQEWDTLAGLVRALSSHYEQVARANRELALREKWLLSPGSPAASERAIKELDASLERAWARIALETPSVLRQFSNEVRLLSAEV